MSLEYSLLGPWSSEEKYQLQPVDLTEYASLLV